MDRSSTSSSSRRLIRNAQLGKSDAVMNEFAQKYWKVVFSWAKRYQIGDEAAQDIAQEVILRVLPRLSQYDEKKGRFHAWLGKITFNCTMNFFNEQKQNNKLIHLEPGVLEGLETAVGTGGLVEESEIDQITSKAAVTIAALKEKFDEDHWLCFEGMAGHGRLAADIGSELGVSPEVVRKRKHRILEALKRMLEVTNSTP